MKNSYKNVRAYKAALKAQMKVQEAAMRSELNEIKRDLNPIQGLGKAVQSGISFFKPSSNTNTKNVNSNSTGSTSSQVSGMSKVVMDTALNFLVGAFFPGKKWPMVRSLAPMLLRETYTSSEPVIKNGLVSALEWVSEATADPVEEPKPEHVLAGYAVCPCGSYRYDTSLETKRDCTCGAVTFGAYGAYDMNHAVPLEFAGNTA